MQNYFQIQLLTEEECKLVLNMPTFTQDRSTLVPEFPENWINGRLGKGVHDFVIEPEGWLLERIKSLFDIQQYAKVDGIWPLIYKEYWVGNDIGYHTDDVKGIKRVGVSIQLNNDYEGGELELLSWRQNTYDNVVRSLTLPRGVGLATIFPIFIPHRVTPITSGKRKQLVTWLTGPYLNW